MLLTNAKVARGGSFFLSDLRLLGGHIAEMASGLVPQPGEKVFDCGGAHVFPGFIDVHVHLREPGFSYKETIASGTRAAARGGYTTVCPMPNLKPAPDSLAHLEEQLALIRRDAVIEALPFGAITKNQRGQGELSDMAAMAPFVAGFSDDGLGVADEATMRLAMREAKRLEKPIAAHLEDMAYVEKGGSAHPSAFQRAHGLSVIHPESEYKQLERDLKLVRETGCRYHACHLSCKESVDLIRRAKLEGLPVTGETGPHYLLLDDTMLKNEGRYKMNPPIRSQADREALLAGFIDGTVDMLATDHAPHSETEKAGGFNDSLMGVVGIETAFGLCYRHIVQTGLMPLSALIDRLTTAPAALLGRKADILPGAGGDLTVFDLDWSGRVEPKDFLSMGRATPFEGFDIAGRCLLTLSQGRVAYRDQAFEEMT